jgi:flagellar motility protein MotE (MotC chaperone)
VIPVNATPNPSPSAAEQAILERLQERRQELEKRARELDIREGLIADAEKRGESKLMQIKERQQQLATAAQKKEETEAARFKNLVTMYETMKPRDAAKIFDRLEVNVLLQVASMMNPRSMSEVLAVMTPDRAEQLTVELANRAKTSPKDPSANLPKIEGHPPGSDTRTRRDFRTASRSTARPRVLARDLLPALRIRGKTRKSLKMKWRRGNV